MTQEIEEKSINEFEYLLVGKDGKIYVLVDSKTGEARKLTFWEKIKLLWM